MQRREQLPDPEDAALAVHLAQAWQTQYRFLPLIAIALGVAVTVLALISGRGTGSAAVMALSASVIFAGFLAVVSRMKIRKLAEMESTYRRSLKGR
ncbi:MAG: hypothetical protein ACRD2W_02365 [Acidimicrobiales bacterium]